MSDRSTSKAHTAAYWIATVLLVVAMGGGGVADIIQHDEVVSAFTKLGYPLYVLPLIGAWKVAGCIAILVPRFPLVKEWAYAGFVIDLTGAAYSHVMAGEPLGEAVAPLIVLGLTVASYVLRPDSRRLPR